MTQHKIETTYSFQQEKQCGDLDSRKTDHLRIIREDDGVDRGMAKGISAFDSIDLNHRGFNQGTLQNTSTKSVFLNKELSMPFMIGAMTGGQSHALEAINCQLARAAENEKVALALGSMRPLLNNMEDATIRRSFCLRPHAPSIPILANIGIAQVAAGMNLSIVKKALTLMDVDALVVHFNALQEAVQPEGESDFTGLKEKLTALVKYLSIPVIAKEVGCGFSLEDMEELHECGISQIEVAGRGGTSWSRVEHHRRKDKNELGMLFQDWGILTTDCLMMGAISKYPLKLIASGGVRNGIDMAKALAMGASCTAMARPVLLAADQGDEALLNFITSRRKELQTAMFLVGARGIDELIGNRHLWRYKGGDR